MHQYSSDRQMRLAQNTAIVFAAMLSGLAIPSIVSAQDQVPGARVVVPFVGLSVGSGQAPEVLLDRCSDRVTASAPQAAIEMRGGLDVERLAVEAFARVSGSGFPSGGRAACFSSGSVRYESGIHEDRSALVPSEGISTLGLRLGYRLPAIPVVLLAGAGWAANQELPVLGLGGRIQSRGDWRVAVAAQRDMYRVSTEVVTQEWRDREVVRRVSRRRDDAWMGGWTLDLGVEHVLRW